MSFQCTIVTPEEQSFDQQVTQVILPAHDGQLGILTNRAPILVRLGAGSLQVDLAGAGGAGGNSQYFFVDGGVAQMKGNKLTLLTHKAVPASALVADDVRAELAKAEAMPATDKATREKRELALRRARGKMSVLGK